MKTLSVREVAEVLGITTRAVLKKLNNGQLKGTRRLNKYGVEEWWVYPNKDIRTRLEAAGRIDFLEPPVPSVDGSAIEDIHETDVIDDQIETADVESKYLDARGNVDSVAEELWNNLISRFVDRLEEKERLIGEMQNELIEKDRQLRLLPDLQKQAEEERQAAQLRAHEAEALRKQIVAIEQEKEKKEIEAAAALRAAEELKLQSVELTEKLAAETEEKKRVDEQLAEMKTHLEALTAKVERSWWKKFFGVQ